MMNPTGGKVATGHNHGGGDKNKEADMSKMDMTKEVMIDRSNIPSKFKVQLGDVVMSYLLLKDKLSQDDAEIQKEVRSIQKSLKGVDMSLVMEDAHNEWMKTLKTLNKELSLLSKAVNIKEQRTIFLTISKSLSGTIQKLGVEMGEDVILYLQYCPMANDNKGGYWLSNEKEIKNPYFGKEMPDCGEVKSIIK